VLNLGNSPSACEMCKTDILGSLDDSVAQEYNKTLAITQTKSHVHEGHGLCKILNLLKLPKENMDSAFINKCYMRM
jgi:hypothetical protein